VSPRDPRSPGAQGAVPGPADGGHPADGGFDELTPRAAEALLRERARGLARPVQEAGPAAGLEVVSFTVAGETYAIEVRYVFQALRLRHVAALESPGEPLVGLTAWRGDLLPLLDLGRMTGAPPGDPGDRTHAIVLGDGRPEFGILADAVDRTLSLSPSEIRSADGLSRAFIRGVGSDVLLVLDGLELIRSYTREASP